MTPGLGLGESIIPAACERAPLLRLIDYLLVHDIDFPNHQEAQILDDVRRQGPRPKMAVALDVESKTPGLEFPRHFENWMAKSKLTRLCLTMLLSCSRRARPL